MRGAKKCPACHRPPGGQAQGATTASGSATPDTAGPHRHSSPGWDALVLGTITLVVVVAAVAWLV